MIFGNYSSSVHIIHPMRVSAAVIVYIFPLLSFAQQPTGHCTPEWKCSDIDPAPSAYPSADQPTYQGAPGQTVDTSFTFEDIPGIKTETDSKCGEQPRTSPVDGFISGGNRKTVPYTIEGWRVPGSEITVTSPIVDVNYKDCDDILRTNTVSENGAQTTIIVVSSTNPPTNPYHPPPPPPPGPSGPPPPPPDTYNPQPPPPPPPAGSNCIELQEITPGTGGYKHARAWLSYKSKPLNATAAIDWSKLPVGLYVLYDRVATCAQQPGHAPFNYPKATETTIATRPEDYTTYQFLTEEETMTGCVENGPYGYIQTTGFKIGGNLQDCENTYDRTVIVGIENTWSFENNRYIAWGSWVRLDAEESDFSQILQTYRHGLNLGSGEDYTHQRTRTYKLATPITFEEFTKTLPTLLPDSHFSSLPAGRIFESGQTSFTPQIASYATFQNYLSSFLLGGYSYFYSYWWYDSNWISNWGLAVDTPWFSQPYGSWPKTGYASYPPQLTYSKLRFRYIWHPLTPAADRKPVPDIPLVFRPQNQTVAGEVPDRIDESQKFIPINSWTSAWPTAATENVSQDFTLDIAKITETKGKRGAIYKSPFALLVDANRDGIIKDDNSDITTQRSPYRFWSNDDDDSGDEMNQTLNGGNSDEPGRLSGFWEMDGRTPDYDHDGVDGRCDLADFFPVFLDIKQLLTVLPPGGSIQYKLKQADSALNFVYTDLMRSEARDYLHLNKERAVYGVNGNTQPHVAETYQITAAGVALDSGFLDRVKTGTDKGLILIEGRQATDKPLVLTVEKDGVTISEISLHIKISEVEKMYRWINLRGAVGQAEIRPSNLSEPANYPDKCTNGKMFIWVHGYNVDERQSRAWNAEAFKRMYQSGSRAMFTAVSWFGDYSQVLNTVAPNYWQNITNAFRTSALLAPAVSGLPGSSKVIVGHSMGNVVISSAIKDHNMGVTKYFMLNAAVAVEAYDTSALSISAMRPNEWANIEERLWSTKWHELFPAGDGRKGLTWQNRFGNISNAINYYSSGEDVLNNNNNPGVVPTPGGERAWVYQEMTKGVVSIISDLTLVQVQGGWGVDTTWYEQFQTDTSFVTNDIAKVTPFFTRFAEAQIMNAANGSAKAAEYVVRANALGGAIPALSFPAGRNAVSNFGSTRNVDVMTKKDGWPRSDPRWRHSDAKNAAYYFNYKLWEDWVTTGDLK